jgi:DNA modification methylase
MRARIIVGDAAEGLRSLPDGSHQCCVTSPPYYGLRDYNVAGQIGLEAHPAAYIERLVEVFREVRRVLRPDGTLWLNMGDSYAGSWGAQSRGGPPSASSTLVGNGHRGGGPKIHSMRAVQVASAPKRTQTGSVRHLDGIKPKDLMGMPWMLAFALRADGWWLRSDIIWHKPNPMPESVRDRPTSAHEHVFLLTKAARYFYDAAAIAEIAESFGRQLTSGEFSPKTAALKESGHHGKGGDLGINYERECRNARNVWTIATQPYSGAHFATMPPALVERCIKAGSRAGDLVLDPFGGAGTTGLVALEQQRGATLIELNPDYADLARRRIGLFAEVA